MLKVKLQNGFKGPDSLEVLGLLEAKAAKGHSPNNMLSVASASAGLNLENHELIMVRQSN